MVPSLTDALPVNAPHHTTRQILNSYLTLCCVGTALAAAVFALAIEAKVAFFTFLIAYSTAKVRGVVSRLLLLLLQLEPRCMGVFAYLLCSCCRVATGVP